jgi:dihydrofolate reductase
VGRKTLASFPGGKPLPNRVNVVLTRQVADIPGVTVCHSVQEAADFCENASRCFVIGGGTVYRQMLALCDRAYITKVHTTPNSDTYFPNLDQDPQWECAEILQSGEENGIAYEMCLYIRK